ncbi:hypothetical protein [Maricaulis sp.]|uniref:hypothetical protein n=1 Tax=Maricaulis sp. TaxID=1486257 RepID=UPI002632850D|nr:hypothetical protein [Maricaulis sp.]
MGVDIKTVLKAALAGKTKVDIGQFQMLNVDEIKAAAGENWPKLRQRVVDTATHFIQKRLSTKHVTLACADGFLIVFADEIENPKEDIAEIREALIEFFLGSPDLPNLQLVTKTLAVSPEELVTLAGPAKSKPPQPRPVAKVKAQPDQPARKIPPPDRKPEPVAPGHKTTFLPIWDGQSQSVAANLCIAKVQVEGRWIDGRRALQTQMADTDHLTLDITAASQAVQNFTLAMRKKRKVAMAISLHETTLLDPAARDTFLDCFSALPEPVRKAFWLRLESADLNAADTARAVEPLQSLGYQILVERRFGDYDFSAFQELDVAQFACRALKPANAETEGMLDQDTTALNAVVGAARDRFATTFMDEIRDLKTLKQAMACGVRYMSGPGLLPEAGAPMPCRTLGIVDLCRMARAA